MIVRVGVIAPLFGGNPPPICRLLFSYLIIHLTHSLPSAHGPRCRRSGGETCLQSCRSAWLRPATATTQAADLLVQSQMRDLDNQVWLYLHEQYFGTGAALL